MKPNLSQFLQSRLLGQDEAVMEFSEVVDRAESGPSRAGRLKGFVLLLGPTGTGKTEMVKATTEYLYGDDAKAHLARFDMAEYQHRDSIVRFLGGPGQPALLGEAIDRLNAQGGGVILLDEIEKAYPDLRTVLLSFDDARSTMSDGSVKDLSNCYVILTSNLGAADAARMVSSGYSAIRRRVINEAEIAFNKEGVARFTATVVMNVLTYEVQQEITRMALVREMRAQMNHLHRCIEIADPSVITFLVGKGFTPDLGARQIRKTVERYVGNALLPYVDQMPEAAEAGLGDLLTDSLILRVEGDTLKASPPRRHPAFQAMLTMAA